LRPRGNLFEKFPFLKSSKSRGSHKNTPKISPKMKNFLPRAGAHEEDSAPLLP